MSAAYLQALHADADEPAQERNAAALPQQAGSSSNGASAPLLNGHAVNGSRGGQNVDVASEDAFPSLAGPGLVQATTGGKGKARQTPSWGQHLSQPAPAEPVQPMTINRAKDTLVLASSGIYLAPAAASRPASRRDEGPITSIGEAAALVMKLHPSVRIDASTSKATTTFILAGPTDQAVARAKQDLVSRIARKVSVTLDIPGSARAHIIGSKGRTLKSITDQTGAQINIPPRENNENADSEDAAIPVTITGHTQACEDARQLIQNIVNEREAKIVHSAVINPTEFEAVYWPFVQRAHSDDWNADNVKAEHSQNGIKISGEKDKVQHWQSTIKNTHDHVKQNTRTHSIVIEKKQHRFLRGSTADDILKQTGWAIELPPLDSADERVVLRGIVTDKAGRIKAMELTMEMAEAHEVATVDLLRVHSNAPEDYAANLCRYLSRRQLLKKAIDEKSAQVYLPSPQDIAQGQASMEIVANSPETLEQAKKAASETIKSIPPSHLTAIHVDPLLHTHILPSANTKHSKSLKAILERHSACDLVFPTDAKSGNILLCWTASDSEPKLAEIKREIEKIIHETASITSESVQIPAKYHDAIQGPNNTTLNAVIGAEKNVAIEFGKGDEITVRGPKDEIARVRKEMQAIAERAETEGVEMSYENEFDLDARFVGYIVGKNGSNINKLHEELGVNVQIQEAQSQANGDAKNAKKTRARAHILIRGRRENVEEARKRIVSHAERVADETTVTLALPSTVDRRNLVGKGGAYAQRLESKYEVRVIFPRANDDTESDITIRGPRKGVEGAKKELQDLIDYERETSHSVTIQVPASAVSRVVGKQGSNVNQISSETGASIDVDTSESASGTASVTIKGTKDAVAQARRQVQAVAKDTEDEVVVQVQISRAAQPALIGKGGQNIRDMMARAGGPSDVRSQGYMIRFPRQNEEPGDIVTLRGKSEVVEKLRSDILSQLAQVGSKSAIGLAVPKAQHASIIGRGGRTVNEISNKHNVKIYFPSGRDSRGREELSNAAELADSPVEDVIRVIGPPDACEAACADILARANSSNADSKPGSSTATPISKHTKTVMVPAQYHRAVSDNGRFFRRSVPPRINIEHGKVKLPKNQSQKPFASSSSNNTARSARIDMDEAEVEQSSHPILDFEILEITDNSEDLPDIPWVISGASEDLVDQTEEAVQSALERVRSATHVAHLRVARQNMPRLIGRGGSGLDQIRASAGVEVEVLGQSDADTLSLKGSLQGCQAAKDEVTRMLEKERR